MREKSHQSKLKNAMLESDTLPILQLQNTKENTHSLEALKAAFLHAKSIHTCQRLHYPSNKAPWGQSQLVLSFKRCKVASMN